jgi:hypothetical protein
MLLQYDRSLSLVSRLTGKRDLICTVDQFASNLKRSFMTVKHVDNDRSQLSLFRLENGTAVLVGHGIIDGVAADVLNAPALEHGAPVRFAVVAVHSITPGRKWMTCNFITDHTKESGQLTVEPVPTVSGIASVITEGSALFSEDQSGWFAGSIWLGEAALKAYPQMKAKDPVANGA